MIRRARVTTILSALCLPSVSYAQALDPVVYKIASEGTHWESGSPYCPGPFAAALELFPCIVDYHQRLFGKCPILENVTVTYDASGRPSVLMTGPTPYCTGGSAGVFGAGVGLVTNGTGSNGVSCLDAVAAGAEGSQCQRGVGGPINPSLGSKYLVESDYLGQGPFPLTFERYYNSLQAQRPRLDAQPLGPRWWSTLQRSIVAQKFGPLSVAYLYRPNGRALLFEESAGVWTGPLDVPGRLEAVAPGSGWRYTSAVDEVETYDASGRLLSIANRAGLLQRLTYSNGDGTPSPPDAPPCPAPPLFQVPAKGLAWCLTDAGGRPLTFSYDNQSRLARMALPGGEQQSYSYNASGLLASVTRADGRFRTYVYNEPLRTGGANYPWALTGIVDENGDRHATYEYRFPGRAVSTERAGGADRFTLAYNLDGSTTVTRPLGAANVFAFTTVQGVRRRTTVAGPPCPDCGPASEGFDGSGFVSSRSDWNGNVTTYSRTDPFRPDLETSRTEAVGTPQARTVETMWHPTFRLPSEVHEITGGRKTTTTYDDHGNVTARTVLDVPSGRARTWTYAHTYSPVLSGLLERTVVDGPRADVADLTAYDYYAADAACTPPAALGCRGHLRRITNALGHVTEIRRYDAHGHPEEIVDANGLLTTLTYDVRQRLARRTVGAETTRYDYDGADQLTRTTFPDGSFVDRDYDAAHRLVEIRDNLGNRVAYTLDAMGHRTGEQISDPGGTLRARHAREYDALGRLQKDIGGTDPATQVTQYGHDGQGNVTSIDGPLAGTPNDLTRVAYDPLNRLRQVTDAHAGLTRFDHDALDQLIAVTDPRDHTTSYTLNALGEQAREVSPDRGVTEVTFDAAGNAVSRTDARGKTTTRAYDALNRVTSMTFSDSTPALSFEYEGSARSPGSRGRLHRVGDAVGNFTAFTWTREGRLLTRVQGTAAGVRLGAVWTYDGAGRLSSLKYPSGKIVTREYDAAGRPNRLSLGAQTILWVNAHFPFGAPEIGLWGNGRPRLRERDLDGRISRIDLDDGHRTLDYDAAGRVRGLRHDTQPAADETLGHDALDRLTSWQRLGRSRSYGYDANGNRTSLGLDGTLFPYSVAPDSNRLLSTVGPGPARTFAYDEAGNVVADGLVVLVHDARGRLVASQRGLEAHAYVVNGLGERVAKSGALVPSGLNHFFYDEDGRLLGEYGVFGTPIQENVWWGDDLVAVLKADGTYFADSDHLGTPIQMRDAAGEIVWRWDQLPFAENAADTRRRRSFMLNLRLPGQYFDQETGLHYNYHRDYDPQTGRYVEVDPIGLGGGPNPYLYVGANPLGASDRLGRRGPWPNPYVLAAKLLWKTVLYAVNWKRSDPPDYRFSGAGATAGWGCFEECKDRMSWYFRQCVEKGGWSQLAVEYCWVQVRDLCSDDCEGEQVCPGAQSGGGRSRGTGGAGATGSW